MNCCITIQLQQFYHHVYQKYQHQYHTSKTVAAKVIKAVVEKGAAAVVVTKAESPAGLVETRNPLANFNFLDWSRREH